jgi:hypothetical protein
VIRDVYTKEHEDRMESFALSETFKYLYLLFDEGISSYTICLTEDNPLHSLDSNFVFTTEGHPIHLKTEHKRTVAYDNPFSTCQLPPSSTSFFSSILSIPDAFHPFTSNTSLNSMFIPLLDTRGVSTQRTILEVCPYCLETVSFSRNSILFSRLQNLFNQRQIIYRYPFSRRYDLPMVSTFQI